MARLRNFRAPGRDGECEHVRDLMSDFVDDELEPGERQRVERHLAICPRCGTVLANLRRTLGALAGLGSAATPGADAATEAAKRAWHERTD